MYMTLECGNYRLEADKRGLVIMDINTLEVLYHAEGLKGDMEQPPDIFPKQLKKALEVYYSILE